MIVLFALLACSPAPTTDTAPELEDTAPPTDTGETGVGQGDTDTDTAEGPAVIALANLLAGPVRGYFLMYSAELDAYPDEDGWIYAPTLWTFGDGSMIGAGDLAAYVWNEDPSDGGYQLDQYQGTFTAYGDTLTLDVNQADGSPDFGIALVPAIEDDGTVAWPWTLRDGTEGVITLNPTWDTYPGHP
jgi:hypothetical protein